MSQTCNHRVTDHIMVCQHLLSGQSGRYIRTNDDREEYVYPACIRSVMAETFTGTLRPKCETCLDREVGLGIPTRSGRIPHFGQKPKMTDEEFSLAELERVILRKLKDMNR